MIMVWVVNGSVRAAIGTKLMVPYSEESLPPSRTTDPVDPSCLVLLSFFPALLVYRTEKSSGVPGSGGPLGHDK